MEMIREMDWIWEIKVMRSRQFKTGSNIWKCFCKMNIVRPHITIAKKEKFHYDPIAGQT